MTTGPHGTIQIDNKKYTGRIGILPLGHSIFFYPENRTSSFDFKISVRPMPASALVRDSNLMQTGFYYSVQGTDIGTISEGPAGHISSITFTQTITEFILSLQYKRDFLHINLSGRTSDHSSRMERDGPDVSTTEIQTSSSTFEAEIFIPPESIASALKLTDQERYDLYEKLEKIQYQ